MQRQEEQSLRQQKKGLRWHWQRKEGLRSRWQRLRLRSRWRQEGARRQAQGRRNSQNLIHGSAPR